jgi:hypothetical protein
MVEAHGQQSSSDCVARLSDSELIATVHRLLHQERSLSARLLEHLAEVDARGLYRQHAYSSMFDYCVQALHLSESEAYLRIRAARLCRQFPSVLHLFAAGELHLSALKLLAPVLTETNCEELLDAARFKSKRDVELLLAQRAPQPAVPNVIRKLPPPARMTEVSEVAGNSAQAVLMAIVPPACPVPDDVAVEQAPKPELVRPTSAPTMPASVKPSSTLSPLGANRYKVQLTASQQLHDKLRQAQDLLRHELPAGDLADVVERALDLLIAERMKRRFGLGREPRAAKSQARARAESRHIPTEVRRQVLQRDGARCTFVSTDGKRCDERGGLELHHEQPFAKGGPATLANIRVLCRAHNQLLAERDYGRTFMHERVARERSARERVPGPARDTPSQRSSPVERQGLVGKVERNAI